MLAAEAVLAALPRPPAAVLDLTGTDGHWTFLLSERGYQPTFAASEAAMLQRARRTMVGLPFAVQNRVQVMTRVALPDLSAFPAASFDAVLLAAPAAGALATELTRVLRPGAAVVTVPVESTGSSRE